jgi:hypothetical protein
MFELVILLVGVLPLVVGLYAIRMMRNSEGDDADDPPPPAPPQPPIPITPPSPRHRCTPVGLHPDHPPAPRHALRSPGRPSRVGR